MRGFAQEQAAYYTHLVAADPRRKGDYDGRGVLSESGLVEFITFAMNARSRSEHGLTTQLPITLHPCALRSHRTTAVRPRPAGGCMFSPKPLTATSINGI